MIVGSGNLQCDAVDDADDDDDEDADPVADDDNAYAFRRKPTLDTLRVFGESKQLKHSHRLSGRQISAAR